MSRDELWQYYQICIDCWNIFKKYSSSDDGDEYWDTLKEACKAVCDNHGKQFAKEMSLAVYKELSRILERKNGR